MKETILFSISKLELQECYNNLKSDLPAINNLFFKENNIFSEEKPKRENFEIPKAIPAVGNHAQSRSQFWVYRLFRYPLSINIFDKLKSITIHRHQ